MSRSLPCESRYLHREHVRALVGDNHFIELGIIPNEPCTSHNQTNVISNIQNETTCTHRTG